jgi:hypothetical protein
MKDSKHEETAIAPLEKSTLHSSTELLAILIVVYRFQTSSS